MKIPFLPLLAGALMLGTLSSVIPAHSQGQNPAPLQSQKTVEIPLKNVPAHLMAWWLDPIHQPRPAELGPVPHGEHPPIPLPNDGKNPLLGLNANVHEVQADDVAKLVRVSVNNLDIQKVRDLVTFLDQPLRYVEIETRLVQLTNSELNRLHLDFNPKPTDTPQVPITPTIMFVRVPQNVTELLAPLNLAKSRHDISTLQILNNGGGLVEFSHSHPLTSKPQADDNADPGEVRATIKIHLTPTLNNDNTFTLLSSLVGRVEPSVKDTIPAITDASLYQQIIFNVKAGETIAMKIPNGKFMSEFTTPLPHDVPLIGDIPLIGQLFRSRSRSNNLVLFFTARPATVPTP